MVSFVDEHRAVWPVAVMCRTIGLPERTFHAAKVRPPSARSVSDELHAVEIRRVWIGNYSCYGAPASTSSCDARATSWRGAPSPG
jgi:putative transposase